MKTIHAESQHEQRITMQSFCQLSKNSFCKVSSILQYFQMDEKNLDLCKTDFDESCDDLDKFGLDAEDWHDQIMGCTL